MLLMRLIIFLAVATICLYLLRAAWRMLVEVPARPGRRYAPFARDIVETALSRMISTLLAAQCGLFLIVMLATTAR